MRERERERERERDRTNFRSIKIHYYHVQLRVIGSIPFRIVTPRSREYGDVTVTYIRRSEIPSRVYAKRQYRKELEYGSTWCIIHSNI